MTYADIDPILKTWADKHNLHIFTEHQHGDEVRHIPIFYAGNEACRIAVTPVSDKNNTVLVDVWSRDKTTATIRGSLPDLETSLDVGYRQAMVWIREKK